jgi:hypothetical protein
MKFILTMIVAFASVSSAMASASFVSADLTTQLADIENQARKLANAPAVARQGDETPAPVACYAEVMSLREPLSETGAVYLCSGASSADAPVSCFNKAKSLGSLSWLGAARLCQAAPSDAPIVCFEKATALGRLNLNGSVDLCVGSDSADASISCFNKAMALGSLSETGAVDLCGKTRRKP